MIDSIRRNLTASIYTMAVITGDFPIITAVIAVITPIADGVILALDSLTSMPYSIIVTGYPTLEKPNFDPRNVFLCQVRTISPPPTPLFMRAG
jgi:hypothetical protein